MLSFTGSHLELPKTLPERITLTEMSVRKKGRIRLWIGIGSLSGGGAERQCELLLSSIDPELFVVRVGFVNSLPEDLSFPSNVSLKPIFRKRKWRWDCIWRGIKKDFDEFNPDIIHLWLPDVITIPGACIAFWQGIPVVSSIRSSIFEGLGFCGSFRSALNLIPHFLSSTIISNFPVEKEPWLLKKWFQFKGASVIPNGIDVKAKASRREPRSECGAFSLLFVGRFVDKKRLDWLLKVLATLKRSDWSISVFGRGTEVDERRILKLISDLDIKNRVFMEGYNTNWRARAAEFDFLVFPSLNEGMPNAVVEAMAEGLPVIGSDIPSLRNIVIDGHNGYLFCRNNSHQLAKILENIPNYGGKYEHLSCEALATAKRYGVEKMVRKYEKLYRGLASSRRFE